MSNEMRAHAAVGEIHQVESRRTRGKGKVSYSDEVSVGYAALMSFQSVERARCPSVVEVTASRPSALNAAPPTPRTW